MSPGSPTIRVALVGFGLGGSVFHAPLIARTPGLRLDAIVTGDPERQARARAEYPETHLVDSPDRLWEQADGLDLLVVAAPNRAHVPLARAALDAGLHVVVDKPVAPTADEARRLAEAARERGRLVVPFHNRRWDGDFLTLRRLVADGELGQVRRLESRFERWRPAPRTGWKERSGPGEATGLLYDLGSHLIDQALVLAGPVTHVYAELDRRRPWATVDDDVFVALTHASGVRSHLHASAVVQEPGPRFRVLGDRAAWIKRGLDPQEGALAAGMRPGDPGWGEEPADQRGTLATGDGARPVPTERGAYERFYAGIAAALRDGAPPPVDVADAVAGLEIIEAAHRSAAEREVVAVGPHP
jgi:predicted dehydrogenase